jgi:tRNA pseudouridine55 synthase
MPDEPTGIVVVDKPAGWTSHDVVARMRRLLGTRKVGHGGTLDPMATGVLVIACGKATRLLQYYSAHDKDYTATIRLGQSTVTDDAEGEVTAAVDASAVTDAAIASAVATLTGDIQQAPSSVSAIKVDGKRAYARVRGGEDVALAPRPVTVARFDVLDVRRADAVVDIEVDVTVSSGTYVRALARDLGAALGVGGHLITLRRTRVGGLSLEHAATLEELEKVGAASHLVGLTEAARAVLAELPVDAAATAALGYGQRVPAPGVGPAVAVHEGDAIAIVDIADGIAKPLVVFAPATG